MARRFGHTWWGRAWIDALEHRAALDPNRLPRGRTYARHGHVGPIDAVPGLVRAEVQGSRRRPYRVELRVRMLADDEWDRLLGVIVAKAERTAALLDGELDPSVVEDAAAAGIDLLPHAGELRPRCSCPDWADPCKHAAAVCYLVADELDADPFALLRLRGRDRSQVLAAVRRLRAGAGSDRVPAGVGPAGDDPDEGVRASEAWARPVGPLPTVPVLRPQPSRVAAPPIDPPPGAGFTAGGLDRLAADAALRAWLALAEGAPLGLELGPDEDIARRAATVLGTGDLSDAARRLGTTPRALARRAIAWEVAGMDGLAALGEERWRADPLTMAAAVEVVIQAGIEPDRIEVDHNRISLGPLQLRLARDGRWWRFARRAGAWDLDAGPATDPDELLDIE